VADRPAEITREAVAALGHSVGIQYAAVVVMLGIGVFTFWILRAGYRIKELSARMAESTARLVSSRALPR